MIVAVGDVHGSFGQLVWRLKRTFFRDVIFIQVGDFGLIGKNSDAGFAKAAEPLDQYLSETGSRMYVIRGNHDDKDFWIGKRELPGISNIMLVPDGSILDLDGKKCFFAGGGISVDRKLRWRMKPEWWCKDEGVELPVISERHTGIDLVVTHSAPDFCEPVAFSSLVLDYAKYDPSLITELLAERAKLAQLYLELVAQGNPLKQWIYGHFHFSARLRRDNTEFILLDTNEIKML